MENNDKLGRWVYLGEVRRFGRGEWFICLCVMMGVCCASVIRGPITDWSVGNFGELLVQVPLLSNGQLWLYVLRWFRQCVRGLEMCSWCIQTCGNPR